jgi:hypothetical protein
MRWVVVCVVASGCGGCNSEGLNDSPDGASPDAAVMTCAGLAEAQCKAAPGCVADYCNLCGCAQQFTACRATADAPTKCPWLGCPVGICCDGADEPTCRAHSAQGCTVTMCPDCDGNLTIYGGCTGPTAGEPACPEPKCPGRCHIKNDCSGFEECVAPGAFAGCGICAPPGVPCTSDSDCAGVRQQICDVGQCACTGAKSCIDGCDVTGCGVGEVCGSDLRCKPQSCPCPANFDCTSAGCIRHACSTDTDCPGAFCVESQPFGPTACFSQLGTCEPEPE